MAVVVGEEEGVKKENIIIHLKLLKSFINDANKKLMRKNKNRTRKIVYGKAASGFKRNWQFIFLMVRIVINGCFYGWEIIQ